MMLVKTRETENGTEETKLADIDPMLPVAVHPVQLSIVALTKDGTQRTRSDHGLAITTILDRNEDEATLVHCFLDSHDTQKVVSFLVDIGLVQYTEAAKAFMAAVESSDKNDADVQLERARSLLSEYIHRKGKEASSND